MCLAAISIWQASLSGAEYIGSSQCAACHPANADKQSHSAHALALSKTLRHPRLSEVPVARAWTRAPGFDYGFSIGPNGLAARLVDSKPIGEVVLDWAFGAGRQGMTFVGKIAGPLYLEFSLSYYTRQRVFGITPGDGQIQPVTAQQAMGKVFPIYSPSGEIMECFQCHSTGPVSVSPEDRIEPLELGVRCEACHGPGSAHRDAAVQGVRDRAATLIQSPGRLRAPELNNFCGSCHRAQTLDRAKIDLTFPWNVRHQPPYLERSECFRMSQDRLSCLTCHDPHDSAKRDDPAFYNRICASCHSTAIKARKICTAVKQGDCISCHMPVVEPSDYMKFRSHWIGVYQSQDSSRSNRFRPPRS